SKEKKGAKQRARAPQSSHTPTPLAARQVDKIVRLLEPIYQKKQRHYVALAVAGWLGLNNVDRASVGLVIERLRQLGDDNDPDDRVDRAETIETTYSRLARGETVEGWSKLTAFFTDAGLADKLPELHSVLTFEILIEEPPKTDAPSHITPFGWRMREGYIERDASGGDDTVLPVWERVAPSIYIANPVHRD